MRYVLTVFNVEWFVLEVMYGPYRKRDLYNKVLPLLKGFLKPMYTLHTLYNTLAQISVVIKEQRPHRNS